MSCLMSHTRKLGIYANGVMLVFFACHCLRPQTKIQQDKITLWQSDRPKIMVSGGSVLITKVVVFGSKTLGNEYPITASSQHAYGPR